MRIKGLTEKQKKLKQIKLKFVILPRKCMYCNDTIFMEKMWRVKRKILVGLPFLEHYVRECNYYCQECIHTAEELIEET